MQDAPKGTVLGGILFVSGTTIGAGILALPLSTGLAGFFPATALFALLWVLFTYTALIFVEVTLALGKDDNIVTLAEKTLGGGGKLVAWFCYMLLLYSLNVAYLALGSSLLIDGLGYVFDIELYRWQAPLPFLLIFGSSVYIGARAVDALNRYMMLGLALSFAWLIGLLLPLGSPERLTHVDMKELFSAAPIVCTAFGFHIIIPTLCNFLDHDVSKIKRSIVWGSLLPLFSYITWEVVCLALFDISDIQAGFLQNVSISTLFQNATQDTLVTTWMSIFVFFAIVTSFLGVSLSLSDFLTDGLRLPKSQSTKILIACIAFIPSLFFTITYDRAFLNALEYAGAYGVCILLGILPLAMCYSLRYQLKIPSPYTAPGGKAGLFLGSALCIFIVIFQLWSQW